MRTLDALRDFPLLSSEIHKLESRLWRKTQKDGLQAVMVTSATRGDGKSTTVALLATAMGLHPGRRLIAVDLDLRQPCLRSHFDVEEPPCDLAMHLRGECSLQEAICKTDLPGLDVLLAAPSGSDPDLLLRTTRLAEMMGSLRQDYDLMLIDVPAVIPVADASMIMSLVDGIILVAMAGKTNRQALGRARDICLGMGGNILGLVIGNLQEALPEYGAYEHEYAYGRRRRGTGSNGNQASSNRE